MRDAYVAIADPTRRLILDHLAAEGALQAGDIARRFPGAARPGISRHLRVLRDCGVVAAEKQGKAQIYRLQSEPLAALRDGWLAKFGDMQSASLRALRRKVEGDGKA